MKQALLGSLASLVLLVWSSAAFSQTYTDFDLFRVNIFTGVIEQVTDIPDAGEFNAAFAPLGRTVVHDVVVAVPGGSRQDLYLTNVFTGESTALAGGENGNDAAWSPNGRWIAFDRRYSGGGLYYLPSASSPPVLLRENGANPNWSPNSMRLVFEATEDGSIRTIGRDGTGETIVAPAGTSPVWSPNGRYIAFVRDHNIYRVRVSPQGEPLGRIHAVTNTPEDVQIGFIDWGRKGRQIVFSSNFGGDWDIWAVRHTGGPYRLIVDLNGTNDFDPAVSRTGRWVVFSAAGGQVPFQVNPATTTPEIEMNLSLLESYPNPFRHQTTIHFTLDEERPIEIRLYNSNGEWIKTLVSGIYGPGYFQVDWDGRTGTGGSLEPGVYYYQMISEDWSLSQQLILME